MSQAKARILIVDDEECIQDILKRHLTREGYDCRAAGDVTQAQAALRENSYDLVLTDIMMPGESGFSLLKTLQRQYPETGVLMITAVNDTQVAVDAVKMGACDYITKPIDLAGTQVLVEQALKRRELLVENRRYKQYLETLFQRYVSPDMLDFVLREHPIEGLQSKLLEATVMFCDIRNFSAISRTMPPQELIPRLNKHYFEPATDIIMARSGTINKFIGDGIMAVFGAPLSYSGHAPRAVEAALELLRRLHGGPGTGSDKFPIAIGLATGKVLSGNIGGPRRMDFTVIGDAVNAAAHLEKIAAAGEILLDAGAYEALAGAHPAEPFSLKLKGSESPATAYRLRLP